MYKGSTVGAVAAIKAGTQFRERIVHEQGGQFLLVQAKDIGDGGGLIVPGMAQINKVPGRGKPDVLSAGDVVLQTRGTSYRAAVVPEAGGPMIVAGSLYVLTAKRDRVTPEYLAFFLNLPGTQAALRQLATGSTILNLRRSAVEHLPIPLPSIPEQQQFSELGRLVGRAMKIEEQLKVLRLQELHALAIERGKRAGGASTPPAPKRSAGRDKRPQTLS